MAVITRLKGPARIQAGQLVFTTSQVWTVPDGLKKIDVFVVGAGGGGNGEGSGNGDTGDYTYEHMQGSYKGSGGGGGYTQTLLNVDVTPGQQIPITIGQGGNGANGYADGGRGGSSSFGTILTALGGYGAFFQTFGGMAVPISTQGGFGGSDGGKGWHDYTGSGGVGGTYRFVMQGSRGLVNSSATNSDGTTVGSPSESYGQGYTTKSFQEDTGTLYSSGGGGTLSDGTYLPLVGVAAANTGNGGGAYSKGGSGIVIVRWATQ